jgi:uncharacterized membrane protein YebE (DUF533 family)
MARESSGFADLGAMPTPPSGRLPGVAAGITGKARSRRDAQRPADSCILTRLENIMQDEKPRLGRDVYFALAAVGWADGQLDQEEADAIVRTALEEGISFEEVDEIEQATKQPVDLGLIDRKNLTKEDRLFVYAVAAWMTRLDGQESEAESKTLVRLGDALKIPPALRDYADQVARQVQALPAGDRPARYDLLALRRILGARLAAAQQRQEKP